MSDPICIILLIIENKKKINHIFNFPFITSILRLHYPIHYYIIFPFTPPFVSGIPDILYSPLTFSLHFMYVPFLSVRFSEGSCLFGFRYLDILNFWVWSRSRWLVWVWRGRCRRTCWNIHCWVHLWAWIATITIWVNRIRRLSRPTHWQRKDVLLWLIDFEWRTGCSSNRLFSMRWWLAEIRW